MNQDDRDVPEDLDEGLPGEQSGRDESLDDDARHIAASHLEAARLAEIGLSAPIRKAVESVTSAFASVQAFHIDVPAMPHFDPIEVPLLEASLLYDERPDRQLAATEQLVEHLASLLVLSNKQTAAAERAHEVQVAHLEEMVRIAREDSAESKAASKRLTRQGWASVVGAWVAALAAVAAIVR